MNIYIHIHLYIHTYIYVVYMYGWVVKVARIASRYLVLSSHVCASVDTPFLLFFPLQKKNLRSLGVAGFFYFKKKSLKKPSAIVEVTRRKRMSGQKVNEQFCEASDQPVVAFCPALHRHPYLSAAFSSYLLIKTNLLFRFFLRVWRSQLRSQGSRAPPRGTGCSRRRVMPWP